MKAIVLDNVMVNGLPCEKGDIVDSDENTILNLTRKGKLGPIGDEPEPQNREQELSDRISKRKK